MDSEDLELVDLLQDLDEKSPADEDSVMATPHDDKTEEDVNDAEYSQVFNDETILLENKWYVKKVMV